MLLDNSRYIVVMCEFTRCFFCVNVQKLTKPETNVMFANNEQIYAVVTVGMFDSSSGLALKWP